MIDKVTEQEFTLNKIPWKLEAGTPPIVQVIALKAAIKYINKLGINNLSIYENNLLSYAEKRLLQINGMNLYSLSDQKGPALAFNIKNVHSYDLTKLLDEMKIAIRSGHHCAQPLMNKMGITSSNRASFSFYNTTGEIDNFIESIERALSIIC